MSFTYMATTALQLLCIVACHKFIRTLHECMTVTHHYEPYNQMYYIIHWTCILSLYASGVDLRDSSEFDFVYPFLLYLQEWNHHIHCFVFVEICALSIHHTTFHKI